MASLTTLAAVAQNSSPTLTRRTTRKRKVVIPASRVVESESELSSLPDEDFGRQDKLDSIPAPPSPIKKPARKKRKVAHEETVVPAQPLQGDSTLSANVEHDQSLLVEETQVKKKTRKPRKKKEIADETGVGAIAGTEDLNGDATQSPPKKKRQRKPKEPVVYDIPPVERKETTYKGRLGYACLNTILRAQKPPVFCSRTCRIATIEKEGMNEPKDRGKQNIKDLYAMIEWNEQNKIRFLRMSSEMFPFASHPKYGYDLSYCVEELKAAGDLAKKYGHRLTTHPGQFTQIASPKENVVEASIKELEYHCEMMDRMGLDQDSVMIIHMGGVYGDKESTLQRFRDNYAKLSARVKARLVLENDEICYNVDDLMTVCPQLDIPIVVDYHHDWINPSTRPLSQLIPIINKTWVKKGIKPKQHLSEPRPGAETVMEKRAHADRCKALPDALEFQTMPAKEPSSTVDVGTSGGTSGDNTMGNEDDGVYVEADLMIEAKDKEQAVFQLYRIYGLEDVIYDNLRPEVPPEEQTLQTKGRKSIRSKKLKQAQDEGILVPEDEEQSLDPEMVEVLQEVEGEENDSLSQGAVMEDQ